MLFSLRTKTIFRQLYLLLALHLLNISVDSPDIRLPQVREDTTINDMESIGEWVLEAVLGHDGCVPETDEQESSEHLQSLSALPAFLVPQKNQLSLYQRMHDNRRQLPKDPSMFSPQYSPGIFSPPPEV